MTSQLCLLASECLKAFDVAGLRDSDEPQVKKAVEHRNQHPSFEELVDGVFSDTSKVFTNSCEVFTNTPGVL